MIAKPLKPVPIPTQKGEIWYEGVLEVLREKTRNGDECPELVLADNVSLKRYKQLLEICPDAFCEFRVRWMDKKILVASDPSPAHERALTFITDEIMFAAGRNVFERMGQSHVFPAGGAGIGADESLRLQNQLFNAGNDNGRGKVCPVIFIEIHVSRTLSSLHNSCSQLAAIPTVNLVIGVKTLKKNSANNYRAVYYEYDGTNNPNVPARAVSFGTLALQQQNIDKIVRTTGIAAADIQGFVPGGAPITLANPFPINLPWAQIYTNTGLVVPPGNVTFNLFDLQQEIREEEFTGALN
eukprot:TRINITY_DN6658_c0_g1_i3.p1 TRINITY_DN6658_c0_g1~~TRINITY_DN6658_c0_g1_i3.p1  ORF type:complete len:297 (-),score=46.25 TRINITY_DN6658_c0_g1_i3:82-972(-)